MTTIVPASARPIISADAVAAVRRGLRSEFWPARLPTGAEQPRGTTAAASAQQRPADDRAGRGDAEQDAERRPRPRRPAAWARRGGARTPATRDRPPPAGRRPAAGAGSRSRAARCRRAAPAPARSGRSAGPAAHAATMVTTHAHDVRRDDGPRREDQRLPGQVEAELPEQQPQHHRQQHAEPEADRGAEQPEHERLQLHRPGHLAPRGTEGAQQRELAAALRDQDRERVDDEERADDQRDAGEDQQERGDEADRLEQVVGRLVGRLRRR